MYIGREGTRAMIMLRVVEKSARVHRARRNAGDDLDACTSAAKEADR